MNNKLLIFGLCCSFYLMGMSFVVAAKTDNAVLRVHFRDVVAQAKALAQRPFQDPAKDLPDVVKKLGYDQWRDIRFKSAHSLWGGELFSVQFFHPGFLYLHPVIIHYVDRQGTHQFPFSADLFEYGSKDGSKRSR